MDQVEFVMRDYRMSKTGPEVIIFQIRVVREDGLRSFPLSKQTENEFDGDAHAPNGGFATKNFGVHCYARIRSVSSITVFVLRSSEHFVRRDIVTAGASALRGDSDQD